MTLLRPAIQVGSWGALHRGNVLLASSRSCEGLCYRGSGSIFDALVESPLDIDSLSDAELAARIIGCRADRAGSEEAELCRRLGPRVVLYGRRHLRDEQAALDLSQRVLLLTIEKLRSGEVHKPESIASFVLGVARRLAHDTRRGWAREEPRSDELGEFESLSEQLLPEAQLRQRLPGCFAKLAERERAVLLQSFFEGLSAHEIAETLLISAGNVRVVRHRALARLRACLGVEELS